MRLDLDPAWIRMSMTLWRETADMKLPMADQFKLHFIERRAAILSNFMHTSRAWLILLSHCSADGGTDVAELQALRSEIDAFNAWAKSEKRELEMMGLQESLADNVDAMLADPELAPLVRKLLGPAPGDSQL